MRLFPLSLSPSLPGGQQTIGPHFVAQPKGYLFDVDGTLLDSMPLFLKSWQAVCPEYGLEMTLDAFYGFAGKPLPDIVRELYKSQKNGQAASEELVSEFLTKKKAWQKSNANTLGNPGRIDCVIAIAEEARARGIPIAVATSGLREHVDEHLKAAGLNHLFSFEKGNIVVAADVPRGKPAPDIFLEAARRINVDPRECRAYEDGESGLISAHAAGCHVIDVTGMDAYPSCEGLRLAKAEAARTRTWLGAPAWRQQLATIYRSKLTACLTLGAVAALMLSMVRKRLL